MKCQQGPNKVNEFKLSLNQDRLGETVRDWLATVSTKDIKILALKKEIKINK